MADARDHWERMYQLPVDEIPWEIPEPPRELVQVTQQMVTTNKRALDLACGTGNYTRYLASLGMNATGVDMSTNALDVARARNETTEHPARFVEGDVTRLREVLEETQFDFILDYSLLHHLDDELLKRHAAQFQDLLSPEGSMLVVCYSERHRDAQARGQNTGEFGNTMHFRTRAQVEKHYQGLTLRSYSDQGRLGKRLQHPAHVWLFTR